MEFHEIALARVCILLMLPMKEIYNRQPDRFIKKGLPKEHDTMLFMERNLRRSHDTWQRIPVARSKLSNEIYIRFRMGNFFHGFYDRTGLLV